MSRHTPHERRPAWMPDVRLSLVGILLALLIVSVPLFLV